MNKSDFQVAILYNDDSHISKGDPQDLLAVQYTVQAAEKLFKALFSLGYRVAKISVRESLEELKDHLCTFAPKSTFIFNNCDSFNGNNMGAVEVIRLVERMGYAHTGASAESIELCIDKPRAKERLVEMGVATPRYQVFQHPEGKLVLDFPVIIKPCNEDASMGIDLNSVVTNNEDLINRVAYIIDNYDEPAMVEEFISGRELAVALWGNKPVEALPIAEEDFSWVVDPLQRLLTYESKWNVDSPFYQNIPAVVPASLTRRETQVIKKAAVSSFHAMGLRDFGRVDIRFKENIAYVIDINELPDLSLDAGFWNSARASGISYNQMVEHILIYAMNREGWS